MMQSPLDNSTFFANESHVACLFRDTNFVLDSFGAGTESLSFQLGGIGKLTSRPAPEYKV